MVHGFKELEEKLGRKDPRLNEAILLRPPGFDAVPERAAAAA